MCKVGMVLDINGLLAYLIYPWVCERMCEWVGVNIARGTVANNNEIK